jgi:hypothetical protein
MLSKVLGYGVVVLLLFGGLLVMTGQLPWYHGALVFAAMLGFIQYLSDQSQASG